MNCFYCTKLNLYNHNIVCDICARTKRAIVASAIRFGGVVYTGRRHNNIISDMVTKYLIRKPTLDNEQGFILADGTYVDRIEGARIAIESGQIRELKWPPQLYSEDLW